MLVLYSDNSPICKLFKELTAAGTTMANEFYLDPGYKTGYPWLYYDRDYNSIIQAPKRLKFRASFSYENEEFGIIS